MLKMLKRKTNDIKYDLTLSQAHLQYSPEFIENETWHMSLCHLKKKRKQ